MKLSERNNDRENVEKREGKRLSSEAGTEESAVHSRGGTCT